MDEDRPKPFGLWERWHIANDPRWTEPPNKCKPESFSVMLANGQIPNIEPALIMFRRCLYSEHSVEKFFRELAEQRASGPRAAAARRAKEAEREQAQIDADMARTRRESEVMKSGQEAQAHHAAEEAARQERATRGIW